jgi:hypothetical protein
MVPPAATATVSLKVCRAVLVEEVGGGVVVRGWLVLPCIFGEGRHRVHASLCLVRVLQIGSFDL